MRTTLKLLLSIVCIVSLMIYSSCNKPIEEETYLVNFEMEVPGDAGARIAANVSDFDIPFGEVNLIASNTVTNKYYQATNNGDIVRSIELPLGNYDFIMSSDGDIPFNEFLKFDALINADVPTENTIVLPIESDQALILVKKNIDAVPTIEVSGPGSEEYPVISLYESPNYYYCFVYGSWGYEIKYILGGNESSLIRTFEAKKIYSYEFGSTGIDIEDPFTEVVLNQ